MTSPNWFPILTAFLILQSLAADPARAAAAGPASKDPPAVVSEIADEAAFNTITLDPKAEERLGIKTVPVESKSIPSNRFFGGEVIVAFHGTNGPNPSPSSSSSQSILTLLPRMQPGDLIRIAEAQVDADGMLAAARVQLDAARVVMERTERMLRDRSGSERAVDEARAQLLLAESELERATARRAFLGAAVLPAATPDIVWIRVPIYVGDLDRIDPIQPARVGSLSARNGDQGQLAVPVSAPPSAYPAASSVDLFFEFNNKENRFRLGERVGVHLALKSAETSHVVPWSSVIIDIHGGTWVYERTAPHQYARKRVQIRRVSGETAVLASGPPVGTQVVTAGAAELFGTEVGFSK